MQVESIAKWSILQYFRPSLSYHLSLRPLFCLFLSGHFAQVLLIAEQLMLSQAAQMCILVFAALIPHTNQTKL